MSFVFLLLFFKKTVVLTVFLIQDLVHTWTPKLIKLSGTLFNLSLFLTFIWNTGYMMSHLMIEGDLLNNHSRTDIINLVWSHDVLFNRHYLTILPVPIVVIQEWLPVIILIFIKFFNTPSIMGRNKNRIYLGLVWPLCSIHHHGEFFFSIHHIKKLPKYWNDKKSNHLVDVLNIYYWLI